MKKTKHLILATLVLVVASCAKEDFIKESSKKETVDLKAFKVNIKDFYKSENISSQNTKTVYNSSENSSKKINTISYLKSIFPSHPVERDFDALSKKLSAAKIVMPNVGKSINSAKKSDATTIISYDPNDVTNYGTYEELIDHIDDGYVTPIVDVMDLSSNMSSMLISVNADIMATGEAFLEAVYNNEGAYSQTDINNLNTNIQTVISDYSYQINSLSALTPLERDALNLALVSAAVNISENINNFPASVVNNSSRNTDTFNSGIGTESFFGWISKNIIKPIATFVTTLVVGVVVVVATAVGGALVGGPIGAFIGTGVGFYANQFLRGGVKNFLQWADLYDPGYDVYEVYG
ncbi:MAG: hypothetical protein EOO90_03340 [Pedobacter sp.]|nr:MAG: hypothetical protein EOO90_03340 [Pedobacter sp.]